MVTQQDHIPQIITLRNTGMRNYEIADTLGIDVKKVTAICARLVREGTIERLPRGRKPGSTILNEVDERKIIDMVQNRMSLKAIGRTIGASHETARKRIREIRSMRGDDTLAPSFLTIKEAAAELRVPHLIVYKICSRGGIATERHGHVYQIHRSTMEALRGTIEGMYAGRQKQCGFCREWFHDEYRAGTRKYCSSQCAHGGTKQRRRAHYVSSSGSLTAWRADLPHLLPSQTIPDDDEWLSVGPASQRASVSKMQLIGLRHRGFLTTKPHPTLVARNTGKPVALHAGSEMDVIRRVKEEYERRVNRLGS